MSDKLKNVLINVSLLIAGIFLFALPHPTDLLVSGIPILSYFAFIPIFILITRVSWKSVCLYGFLYGIGSYFVYVFWLATFNPAAMPVIAGMYGLYLMLTFPVMKAATALFPKRAVYAEWIVWCAYEYIKTLGFTGFNYGVTAYSQYRWNIIIQCADIIGVFGLSAIITFTSAWFATVILDPAKKVFDKIKNHKLAGFIWLGVFALVIVYGFVSPVEYDLDDAKTVALIQTNSDPWVGGNASYRRDLRTLERLSDEALAENPDVDFVVWPETAFVPRITYHYEQRFDPVRVGLVENLLEYIDSKEVPFIIGNDDCVKGFDHNGIYTDCDYNAVLLFRPGENCIPPEPEHYWKLHLVPFTESFPFEKLLPGIYKFLVENDTHFWEQGTEPVIFDVDGLKFGTPICFEDTFGSIGRLFARNGAEALVNLSNDAWARSEACQRQHLSMGLFRTVENRIPSVRSTASGQTVIIDPNGRILAEAEPFTESYLVGKVPVAEKKGMTIYTRFGDWPGVLFIILMIVMFVKGIKLKITGKKHGKTAD